MDRCDLTWAECVPVVESESRRYERMGAEIGLERDDLMQEASMAAVQCLASWRPEGGGRTAYVRRAVRNRFADVRRKAQREMRMPHDAQGRPQPKWLTSYDLLAEDNGLPPSTVRDNGWFETRSLLSTLHEQLPKDDWDFLIRTLVHGAHLARGLAPARRKALRDRLRQVQADAQRILKRVLQVEEVMPAIPMPTPEETPECHAKGEQPQGYDTEDAECWNCRDKFTCLPEALERSLIAGKLSQDREVEGVLSGEMTFRTAINRMKARKDIMDRGGTVPAEMGVFQDAPPVPKLVPKPEPPLPEPKPELVPEDHAYSPPPPERKVRVTAKQAKKALKGIRAKATKKRTTKKKPALKKPALKKTPKKTPKKRARPKAAAVKGRATMKSGDSLPPVRANTKEQQAMALGRVKIGQPFELRTGMQLVRKTKNGEHIIVKIRPLGFELEGVTYSALSTAIMYKLRKMTSGNAYFHLEHNLCTEVWSSGGKVLAGHSSS